MTSARIASRWSAALALVAALSFPNPGLGQTDDPFALYARVLELRQAGNLDEAIALAKRVVELSEKTLPSDHPFIKTSRDNLAALHREKGDEIGALNRRVAALYRAGKIAEAAPLAERMLELIRAQKGEDHADTASGMVWLGLLYKQLDRLADAEPLLKRALDNSERTQPANSSLVATRAHHLAGLYQDQGRSDEAEALYKRALAIREGLPAEPLALAATLGSLATLHSSQGKLAEAERLYKRSLEIRQSSQPGNHADIAQDLHNLATFYSDRGRYAEAELLFKRALEIIEQALPAGHPNIARVLNGLAFSYREQGRYAEAEPLHKRVVEINERAYPAGHSIIAQSLYNLGLVYHAQRRLDEAETLYRRALEAREKALWPGHPEIAWSLHNLAGLHYERRKFGEAEQLLQRALEMREKVLPALDNAVALNFNNLAAVEYGRQAWEAAVRYARRAGTIVVQRTKREARSAAIEPTDTASAELANNDFGILLAQGGRVAARGATAWPACGIERRDLHGHPMGVPVVGRVGACPDGRAVFQRRWRAFPAGSRASGRLGIMAAARQGADSRTLHISGKAQCRGRASAPVAYCRDRATPHRARRIPGQGLSRVCGAGGTRAAFLQSHARAASNGRGLDPIRQ